MVVIPLLALLTFVGIVWDTIRVRGEELIFVRMSCTGDDPLIHVAEPGAIIVPAGDGVLGGIVPRTKLVVKFVTFDGGVGARIVAGPAVLGTPMFVTVVGPRGTKVLGVGGRVTVIDVCVIVLAGKAEI